MRLAITVSMIPYAVASFFHLLELLARVLGEDRFHATF
jgi:hypothetical protein